MNVVILVMDTARARSFETVLQSAEDVDTIAGAMETSWSRAFAPAPWTLPSHASLFTGAYPSKHGAHAGHKRLDSTLLTLPEVLQREGYETVAVSNNTWISEEFGFDRGFETFFKTWQYVQSETDFGRIAREEEGVRKFTVAGRALFDGNPVTNLANALYGQFFRGTEDDGARRTNRWIDTWLADRDDSRPFFLFVNYLEPHLEYRPPAEHAEQFLPEGVTLEEALEVPQDAWGFIAGTVEMTDREFEILRALYCAELSYLEQRIGAVLQLLRSAGELEETLLVVTGDHGENIGDHGLMDHQYALYDTLLHVPLLTRGGPWRTEQRTELVQLVDLPPTILDTLEIEAPELRQQCQGSSFHPDAQTQREAIIAEYMAPQPSMDALERRVSELPEEVLVYDRSIRAYRTDQFKYIRYSDGTEELYDVAEDPTEQSNVATQHEHMVDAMDEALDEWLDSFEHASTSENVTMEDDTKARLEDLGYLQ